MSASRRPRGEHDHGQHAAAAVTGDGLGVTGLTADERALCTATACWLAACGPRLGALGLGAAAGAVAALMWVPTAAGPAGAAAVLALLAVPLERLLALRVAFDAGLFRALAVDHCSLTSLDASLAALGLRRAAARTRSLWPRVAGARRLALQHVAVVLLQVVAAGAALLLAGSGGRP